MIVSFLGHSHFFDNEERVNKVVTVLEKEINGESVEFYVGCYGAFESFGYICARRYQEKHFNAKVVFVTPYLTDSEKCKEFSKKCDQTVFPEIEKTPPRYAIIERNKWVVRKSDLIIFYCGYLGGVNIAYEYAKCSHKKFINFYDVFSC